MMVVMVVGVGRAQHVQLRREVGEREEPQYPCSKVWNINIIGATFVLTHKPQCARSKLRPLKKQNEKKRHNCLLVSIIVASLQS